MNDMMNSYDFHSGLGKPLYGRQALIVVPHQKGTGYLRGSSSTADETDSRNIVDAQNGSNGSYLSFVKRVLSFINPFSYLDGGASSSSSGEQSQNGMWQYSEFSHFLLRLQNQNVLYIHVWSFFCSLGVYI